MLISKPFRYLIVIITGTFLLSSCATIVHQKTVAVRVHSDTDSVKFKTQYDSAGWHTTPETVRVPRSEKPLMVTLQKDSLNRTVSIKSHLSSGFWLGNLFSGAGIIGYIIDLRSPKRFSYPYDLMVPLTDTVRKTNRNFKRYLSPSKGYFAVKLSIPEGNHFYVKKGNKYGPAAGFFGITGGFDYFFSNKHCINMDAGLLIDNLIPLPATVDYGGSYDRTRAFFTDIQIGTTYKRFQYNLGLQFTRTNYFEQTITPISPTLNDTVSFNTYQHSIGFAFSGYFRVSNTFHLGLHYYPSLAGWYKGPLQLNYSHLLFFDLGINLTTNRETRKKVKR
ncbi:MAG: hypothetical protein NTW29_07430 [Bacteroidetes bacterium]|nr:hypothetical protein [Bacteroidota bacterium]